MFRNDNFKIKVDVESNERTTDWVVFNQQSPNILCTIETKLHALQVKHFYSSFLNIIIINMIVIGINIINIIIIIKVIININN